MNRAAAAAGSAAFFVLAPGVVAGLVPWWLTGWRVLPLWAPLRWLGVVLLVAGVALLISAFAQFVKEGIGTPAPIAPTEHLVVRGLYRYVRNPMYLAVLATIAGQALILGQLVLGIYGLAVGLAFVAFVRGYEEPTLRDRYGAEYESYQRAVPGWWPRLRRGREGDSA
jgi:protein-S-isoprenylcysteine O-methyltransferase Ste14